MDCSTGEAGTVDFTSTGTFNTGNIFTAELSDVSGSFASSTANGSLALDGMDYYLLRSMDFDRTVYNKRIEAISINKTIPFYNAQTNVIHFPTKGNYRVINIEGKIAVIASDTDQLQFSGSGIFILQNNVTGESYKISIE